MAKPDFYPIEEGKEELTITPQYLSNLFGKQELLNRPIINYPFLMGGQIAVGKENKTFKFEEDKGLWLGNADWNLAPAKIGIDGVATFKNVVLTNSVKITDIVQGSEIAIQQWQSTLTFSATDYRTVAWTSGTITLMDGTSFSISSGNTGAMTALTYIYFDKSVSTTVLQTTTTASNAVGTGKILLAVAQNVSDTTKYAKFQVFSGSGGIGGSWVGADNIIVTNLAAIKADLGSITAGNITLDTAGFIRGGQTAYNTGTGFFLGYSGNAYKFSIGNPAGNYLTWDGTNLLVKGRQEHSAGDTLYQSSDIQRIETSATYTKHKGITVRRGGSYRVKFTLSSGNTLWRAYGRIYVNGVPVGTERNANNVPTEFSEDISGINPNDEIQIYIKRDPADGDQTRVEKFRIYVLDYDSSSVTYDA